MVVSSTGRVAEPTVSGRRPNAHGHDVVGAEDHPRMHVVYVTMQFPAPTETFATNEVRTLTHFGASITVHGLRVRHADATVMATQRGVENVRVTHNGARAFARGLRSALQRPGLTLHAVRWMIQQNKHKPRDMLVSLLLLPRVFDVLEDIERTQPDVVHMYWGHYPALVGHLVQMRSPEIATSLSIVAYDLTREYGGVVDVARNADVVRTHAAVNKPHVARFTGVPESSISVIYNGVDLAWLDRAAAGHPRIPQRVLAVGKLTPNKGTADAIRAFAELCSRWPDASMVIVGDGPERSDLEALCRTLGVEDRIRFLGHVAHARVIAEMAQADVFLSLSRAPGERLPNVVKEGMASECVCITTSTPGIDELIQDGTTGFILDSTDPITVARCVESVFSGEVDRRALTCAAREHVRTVFNLQKTAPTYLHLWRDAVRRRRPNVAQKSSPPCPADTQNSIHRGA